MRASSAASPKPVLYLFTGLAVLIVTYNLFARPEGSSTSLETRVRYSVADEGPTFNRQVVEARLAAQPPVVSETATAPVASGTGVAQGMSFEDVSAVRARLTGVPLAKAHGTPSTQCQLTVDAERQVASLPRLQLGALGAGQCGSLPPALCSAVRGALGGAAEPAAGAPRLLVTTYAGGTAQAERLRLFADHAAALQLPLVALAMEPSDPVGAAAVKSLCFWAPAPAGPGPLARKWAALRLLVEAGIDVLYLDVDGVLGSSPWAALHFDSDFEGLSEAREEL